MNGSPGGVVFLFPGEGGEHDRMGRMLAGRYPVFADAVTAASDAITAAGGPRVWTPRHGFRDPATAATDSTGTRPHPAFVQPALFAYQVATAQLLVSWGVRPDAVIGHGIGEVAAAVTAGALSVTDAARVATARGRALGRLSGTGAVAELLASAAEVVRLVEPLHEKVAMAAVNGPRSVLISGSPHTVETVVRRAERRGIATARSAPDYPAHSHRVIDAVPEFLTVLGRLDPCAPHTRFYSSTRPGTLVDAATAATAEYWTENITRCVDLDTALRRAAADGMTVILEVGPAPVLSAAVRAVPPFTHTTYPTAEHDDEGTTFLTCLAQFHAARALGPAPTEPGARPQEPHRPATAVRQAGAGGDSHWTGQAASSGNGYGTGVLVSSTAEREALRRAGGSGDETGAGFPAGPGRAREFRGATMRAEVTGAGTLASIRLADDPPPTDIIAWTRMVDANRAIRFMSGRVAVDPPMQIDRAGTYVVSGGLGALGSVMVRRLLAAGARDVVVPTRSPRPVPPLLEGLDDRIVVVRCDTADRLDLDNALRDIRESGCTIRGVVHAAQVFEDTVVGAVSAEHAINPEHRPADPGGTNPGGRGAEEPALDAGRLARRFARISVSAANLIELTAADPVAFIAVFSTPIGFAGPSYRGGPAVDDAWRHPATPG